MAERCRDMVMRRTFRALIALAVLVGLSTPLMAEEQQPPRDPALGSLRVTVLDQQGAAILGATVTIAMPPPAEPQSSNANERGEAVFENLPPGKYVVRIESPGFEPADLADVNVRRGRQERKVVRLEIGRFVEEVEVKRDKTDEVLNDAFSSALTQEQIDAAPRR